MARARAPKGSFSTSGEIPESSDPRVRFHKGWFDQTMPTFSFPSYDRLVTNIDADLYASAKYVLGFLRERIEVGTYLIFDQFQDREHELRAFDEFLNETGMWFEPAGATVDLGRVAFIRRQ